MSTCRFLADHCFNEHIVSGLLLVQPRIDCIRAREVGLDVVADAVFLEAAARQDRIVLSHDYDSMIAPAIARIVNGQPLPGLFMAAQDEKVQRIIDELLLIWSASQSDDWKDKITYLPL